MNDLQTLLKQAGERLPLQMPAPVDRRIQARLSELAHPTPRRFRVWPEWTLAGAVAALLIAVISWKVTRPVTLEGWTVSSTGALAQVEAKGPGQLEVSAGPAVLSDEDTASTFEVLGPTRLERSREGLRVRSGKVRVSVRKRPAAATPVRVLVAGGAIEVLGTRFTIVEETRGGKVTLETGRIRFVPLNGEPVLLSPGQSHRWGEEVGADAREVDLSAAKLAATGAPNPVDRSANAGPAQLAPSAHVGPAPLAPSANVGPAPLAPSAKAGPAPLAPSAKAGPAPLAPSAKAGTGTPSAVERRAGLNLSPSAPATRAGSSDRGINPGALTAPPMREGSALDLLLAEVDGLRSRHRYAEAAALLKSALRDHSLSGATAERLRYELSSILAQHLGRGAEACGYLKEIASAEGGTGRYTSEVRNLARSLQCSLEFHR